MEKNVFILGPIELQFITTEVIIGAATNICKYYEIKETIVDTTA